MWFIDKNGSMEKNVDCLLAKIASNITNNKNKKWKKTRSLKVKPYSYKSERLEFHAKISQMSPTKRMIVEKLLNNFKTLWIRNKLEEKM